MRLRCPRRRASDRRRQPAAVLGVRGLGRLVSHGAHVAGCQPAPRPATTCGASWSRRRPRRAPRASRATIAVTDTEANVLGVFRMDGAPATSRVPGDVRAGARGRCPRGRPRGDRQGGDGCAALERRQRVLHPHRQLHRAGPLPAGRGLHARRTALRRAVLEPAVRRLQAPGLAARPLRRSRAACRSTRTGTWSAASASRATASTASTRDPADLDAPPEERVALARRRGFEAPDLDPRRARSSPTASGSPYANARPRPRAAAPRPAPGWCAAGGRRPRPSSRRRSAAAPAAPTRASPSVRGAVLTAADVATHPRPGRAPDGASRARAIRQPLGSNARVSIAVVDVDGSVLGFFQNDDAPELRHRRRRCRRRAPRTSSAAPAPATTCAAPGLAAYLRDDVPLDGSVAFTLARGGLPGPAALPARHPEQRDPGPFSVPIAEWSPFNTGLQLDLLEPGRRAGSVQRAIPRPAQRHHDLPGRRAALQGRPARRRDRRQRRRRRPGRPHRRRGQPPASRRPPERRCDRLDGPRRAPAVRQVPAAPGAVSAMRRLLALARRSVLARPGRSPRPPVRRRGARPEGRPQDPGHAPGAPRRPGRLPDDARRDLLGAGRPGVSPPLESDPGLRGPGVAGAQGRAPDPGHAPRPARRPGRCSPPPATRASRSRRTRSSRRRSRASRASTSRRPRAPPTPAAPAPPAPAPAGARRPRRRRRRRAAPRRRPAAPASRVRAAARPLVDRLSRTSPRIAKGRAPRPLQPEHPEGRQAGRSATRSSWCSPATLDAPVGGPPAARGQRRQHREPGEPRVLRRRPAALHDAARARLGRAVPGPDRVPAQDAGRSRRRAPST